MMWLLWGIFCLFSHGLVIHQITKNYDEPHTGWITLNLDRHTLGTKFATVQQVDWCGSVYPNPPPHSKVVIRELVSCADSGLQHLRLFPPPDPDVPLIMNEMHDPNVIYIDPVHVGGWDEEHQAQIVVRATFDNGESELIQTYRFNPLFQRQSAANTVIYPSSSSMSSSSSPPTQSMHETPKPVIVSPSPLSTPAVTFVEEKNLTSWRGMLVLLSVGFVVLAGIGYTAHKRNPSIRNNREEGVLMSNPSETLDIDEFLLMEQHDEPNDYQQKNQDFLMTLGTGANSAYRQNL